MVKTIRSSKSDIASALQNARVLREFYLAMAGVASSIIEEETAEALSLVGESHIEVDYSQFAIEWISTIPARIESIVSTSIDAIFVAVAGLSIEEAVAAVDVLFKEWESRRAGVISRVEVLGASNYAAFRTYQTTIVVAKRWIAMLDNLVRDSHADAHNQVVQTNEAFVIGDSRMMYPGDPTGSAKEVINCRCTILPDSGRSAAIWTTRYVDAIWRAYLHRTTAWETKLTEVIVAQMEIQRGLVLSILNQYAND